MPKYTAIKYKTGDKVVVNPSTDKDSLFVGGTMNKYLGATVTISRLRDGNYTIREDDGTFYWCDNCFEPVTDALHETISNVLWGLEPVRTKE